MIHQKNSANVIFQIYFMIHPSNMLFLIPFRNKILELTLTSLKYIFVVAEKLPHFELEGPLSLLDSIADRQERQDRQDRRDRQDKTIAEIAYFFKKVDRF